MRRIRHQYQEKLTPRQVKEAFGLDGGDLDEAVQEGRIAASGLAYDGETPLFSRDAVLALAAQVGGATLPASEPAPVGDVLQIPLQRLSHEVRGLATELLNLTRDEPTPEEWQVIQARLEIVSLAVERLAAFPLPMPSFPG